MFFALLCCGVGAVATGVQAADLRVPSQYGTISAAIKAAQTGDRVVVAPGTYNENISIRKNVTVIAEGGAGQTVIDGGGRDTVVLFADAQFDGTHSAVLSGFTIRGGRSGEGRGGGVTMYNTDGIVEHCTITGNVSGMDGGAIVINDRTNGVIRHNTITGNTAVRFGGAIMVVLNSHPLIYGNTINGNVVSGNNLSSGGAIFVDSNSSPQIVNNTIQGNRADFAGGAISLRVGVNAVIDGNTIDGNTAAYGGGVHIESEGGSALIRKNRIVNNRAVISVISAGSGYGGGISVYNASVPTIDSNYIGANQADMGGAGVVVAEQANATLTNNRITNNTLPQQNGRVGGGIHATHGTVKAYNNVIDRNTAFIGGGVALLAGVQATVHHNTIVANTVPTLTATNAASGGGVFVQNTASSASIANNIITKNADHQVFEEHAKAVLYNNLINDDGKGMYFNWDAYTVHTAADMDNSALVHAEGTMSGSEDFVDGEYRIGGASEGVNRGASVGATTYDYDYRLRSGVVDVGAFEYAPESGVVSAAYRFWSDAFGHHFYTLNQQERDHIMATYPAKQWRYEGVAFRAFPLAQCRGDKVYRFWSDAFRGHFYTISSQERDYIIASYPDNVWRYEGEAYCAQRAAIAHTTPLFRFWSAAYSGHFYTISAAERDHVIAAYDDRTWMYEGVGYHVYPR